jgi:hypothetical protein
VMQAALTCVVLSAAMFHWSPEFAYYLGALATVSCARRPCRRKVPRVVQPKAATQATGALRTVDITDGVPFYLKPHNAVLGSAVLGQMQLGSL